MKNFGRKFAGTALAAGLALGTSAFAQKVYTDYDHNANFAQYHTFSIYKVHSSDPIMESRLRNDLEQSLRERGWQEVPQGGDLAVTAISNVKDQQEYNTFYDGLGPGFGYGGWGGRFGWGGYGGRGWGFGGGVGESTTTVQQIPVGTLAVDLYDSHTHQLIFRGSAADEFSTKNADKNARKSAKEVDKIFDKLPKRAA